MVVGVVSVNFVQLVDMDLECGTHRANWLHLRRPHLQFVINKRYQDRDVMEDHAVVGMAIRTCITDTIKIIVMLVGIMYKSPAVSWVLVHHLRLLRRPQPQPVSPKVLFIIVQNIRAVLGIVGRLQTNM